jgi:hypothetical protein
MLEATTYGDPLYSTEIGYNKYTHHSLFPGNGCYRDREGVIQLKYHWGGMSFPALDSQDFRNPNCCQDLETCYFGYYKLPKRLGKALGLHIKEKGFSFRGFQMKHLPHLNNAIFWQMLHSEVLLKRQVLLVLQRKFPEFWDAWDGPKPIKIQKTSEILKAKDQRRQYGYPKKDKE